MTSKAIARSRVQSSVFPLGTFPRRVYESPPSRSACCGATGSVMSRERWDAGLIPSPAQWVKDVALLGSDPWPRNSIGHGVAKREKKKKRKKSLFWPQGFGSVSVH